MPTTTRLALPYPTADDNPDLPAQMQALADRLDTVVAIPYAGDLKFSARTGEHGNWIKADGRALTAGQYTPLRDALIADGSPYGNTSGNPKLPDLRGRAALGAGAGAGLTARTHGASGGEESHALTHAEMPNHTHTHFAETGLAAAAIRAISPSEGDLDGPIAGSPNPRVDLHHVGTANASGALAVAAASVEFWQVTSSGAVAVAGGGAHATMPPYVVGTWFVYGG